MENRQLINNTTVRLGELIDKLRTLPQSDFLQFDFCDFVPGSFGSWRGDHSHLALTYQKVNNGNTTLVSDLLEKALECDHKIFLGWKGGEYEMDLDTPVWVDLMGECFHTGIIDIVETYTGSGNSIIVTSHCVYEG